MQKVYFISGLGADKRAFSFLHLRFCEPIFVDWISPFHNETMESYAKRLRATIEETSPIVVGLSFGGMLVSEMALQDPHLKGILISSNKTATEFPFWLRLGKYLPVYQWIPDSMYSISNISLFWFLGAKGKEQKKVSKQIIKDTDVKFTKWAIYAIMHWKNTIVPTNVVHIHGTADKLLPIMFVKPEYIIQNGEHLMIMDEALAVSSLLKKLIVQ